MKIWSWTRKVLVAAVGIPVVLLGFVMIPLPGPGLLVIVGGLFILSFEFEWARRHLDMARARLSKLGDSFANFRARWRKPHPQGSAVPRLGNGRCENAAAE